MDPLAKRLTYLVWKYYDLIFNQYNLRWTCSRITKSNLQMGAINNYSSQLLLHYIFLGSNLWVYDYSYQVIMNHKRLCFYSSPFSDFFTTKQLEIIFFQHFSNRSLVRIHNLDLEDFEEWKNLKTIEELNLSTFPLYAFKKDISIFGKGALLKYSSHWWNT